MKLKPPSRETMATIGRNCIDTFITIVFTALKSLPEILSAML